MSSKEYKITLKDGRQFVVTAQTKQAALRGLEQQVQPAPDYVGEKLQFADPGQGDRDVFSEMSTGDQMAVGFAKPFVETYYGAKGLFTDLDAAEQRELEALQGVHGAAGTAGEIAGDIAMFAVPGSMVTRGAKAAGAGSKALMAADTALTAGMESLKAPTDEISRGDRAMNATLGAVGGRALQKTFSKAMRGIDVSDAAKQIEKQGVNLTTGQRASGGIPKALERTRAGSPVTYQSTKEAQDRALAEWNDALRQGIADRSPNSVQLPSGREGFTTLRERVFNPSYEAVWEGTTKLPKTRLNEATKPLLKAAKETLNRPQLKQVRSVVNDINDLHKRSLTDGSVDYRVIDKMDRQLKEAANIAYKEGNGDMGALLKAAREDILDLLPADRRRLLSQVDELYGEARTLRDASTGTLNEVFTPDDVLRQVNKSGRAAVEEGRDRVLREMESAREVFRSVAAGDVAPTAERWANLLASLPLAVLEAPGVRQLINRPVPVQQKAELLFRILDEGVGQYVNPGRIGAAYGAAQD